MALTRFGFAGPGDELPIDQWMDDQTDYMGRRDSLDATGREAWDASTRSGENYQANRPTDVIALGHASFQTDSANGVPNGSSDNVRAPDASRRVPAAPVAGSPSRYVRAVAGDRISSLIGTSDPDAIARFQQLNGMDDGRSTIYAGRVYALPQTGGQPDIDSVTAAPSQHQSTAPIPAYGRDQAHPAAARPSSLVERIVNSPNGPAYAQAAGVGAGVIRGAIHTGQDLGKASILGFRLMNPTVDQVMATFGGGTARDQVSAGSQTMVEAAGDRVLHPSHLVQDARSIADLAKRDLLPNGTPQAPTRTGEALRRFRIGENEGEVGFNGAMIFAAPASEAAEAASIGSKAEEIERFVRQGHTLDEAERLAEPYDGMGNHTLARRFGFPPFISESPFFLQRPTWMNKGRFYERHFQVDPKMYGAKIRNGQRGWSGYRIGLQRFGPISQFWFGTTVPLRTTVGAALAGYNLSGSMPNQGHSQ